MNHTNLRGCMMLNNRLRLLWSQHVYRTRFFIISTAADLADLSYVTAWLLQNLGDFAQVFKQFYGQAQAERFQKLLTEHLSIAGELVNAVKNHDEEKANDARERWYKNADEIAEFLSNLNPYWSRKIWTKMLYDHLKMTENEAGLRLSGKYPEDIAEFNRIEAEALKMADYMASGIMKQFKLC